jgi:glycosidase
MTKTYPTIFRYEPPIAGEHRVFVAGGFNQWQQDATELKPESGIYSCTVPLAAGRWEYKFVVDGRWMADEAADEFCDDGQGGRNSVIEVGLQGEPLYLVPVSIKPPRGSRVVYICGDFNHWHPACDRLLPQSDGRFALTLVLPAGRFDCKYLVDGAWWVPPHQLLSQPFGNVVLQVDDACERWVPGGRQLYSFGLCGMQKPRAAQIGFGLVRIQCRLWRDNATHVTAHQGHRSVPLVREYQDAHYDYWAVHVLWDAAEGWLLQVRHQSLSLYLMADGAALHPGDALFEVQQQSDDLAWLQQGEMYQIFCDRFANGDAALNPDFSEWYYQEKKCGLSEEVRHKRYWLQPQWDDATLLQEHPGKHFVFYGGDLPGVLQKLDYLKQLGVSVLYFNPLVMAASNHKYDAIDFMQIDPHFGGNDAFKTLVDACHQMGIKIVLDFAFNHVGIGFFAFQDCLQKGEKSPYYNWFDWYNWPLPQPLPADFKAADYYQCWWGHATLPDLNFDLSRLHPEENYLADEKDAQVNEPLVQHLLDVATFWVRDMQIDGFRLDVPNEVPFWFWKLFRAQVKQLNPACYLVGEIWHNAAEWVGRYFDAVMNYSFFREPVLQCIALQQWPVERLATTLYGGIQQYGFGAATLMMNLLDSHDTYRFLQACNGEVHRLLCALLLQHTWVGVPHLYYGDEVAMQGGGDPDNRRPMNWQWMQDATAVQLHDSVQELIALRRQHPALVYGQVRIIAALNGLLVYTRRLDTETLTIWLNLSDGPHAIEPQGQLLYSTAAQNHDAAVTKLDGWSGVVYQL